jgi:hypothetical protein
MKPTQIETTPLVNHPILPTRDEIDSDPRHRNTNGPSLIRVPEWVQDALGRYYLYYADHKGDRIKLAYADALGGPWSVHEPGALRLDQTPFLHNAPDVPERIDREKLGVSRAPGVPSVLDDCTIPHIASPDVIVDEQSRSLRLYYHGLDAFMTQNTRVATSEDGLHFDPRDEVLASSYLRMFRFDSQWYGLAMPGQLYRSRSGLADFEAGPLLFEPDMRHAGLWLRGDVLWVFWTRVGDAPERILLSSVDLSGDWQNWRESEPVEVRRPLCDWEGALEPIQPSIRSAVDHSVNQLRDPFVYVEDGKGYLVYGVAGESGIAIARMQLRETR